MTQRKQSAGLLMYGGNPDSLKVLIAHPGGPLFAKKRDGYWGIPKGELEPGEPVIHAAKREFEEETGKSPEADHFIPLGSIVQKGGKTVHAWAFEGEWEEERILNSNLVMLEWPPLSGEKQEIPEIDEVLMATPEIAKAKMRPDQYPFVERLLDYLKKQQKLDLATDAR